jgi:hypothetical protein
MLAGLRETLGLFDSSIGSRLGAALGRGIITIVNAAFAMSLTVAANGLRFVALSRKNLLIPGLAVFARVRWRVRDLKSWKCASP